MRALRYTDDHEFLLDDVPDPRPRAGQVLLAVEYCGICGTDLHAQRFDGLFATPVTLGHEFTATVVELGPEVERLALGDRVAVNPAVTRSIYGIQRDGGMASLAVVDEANVVRLPDGLALDVGAWAEPLAVALRGVRHAAVAPGERVVVFGAGPIGQLAAQVARTHGASEVVVVERAELRRGIARASGALAVSPEEFAAGDGEFDLAIDCAGAPGVLDAAIARLRVGGRAVVIGAYTKPVVLSEPWVAQDKEVAVRWSFSCGIEDFVGAIDLLAAGQIDVGRLTSGIVSLEEHASAFAAMNDPEQAIKVLLRPAT